MAGRRRRGGGEKKKKKKKKNKIYKKKKTKIEKKKTKTMKEDGKDKNKNKNRKKNKKVKNVKRYCTVDKQTKEYDKKTVADLEKAYQSKKSKDLVLKHGFFKSQQNAYRVMFNFHANP